MSDRVPVLLYHSIGSSGAPGLAPFEIDRAGFIQHMSHLARTQRTVIPLAEYAEALRTGDTTGLSDRPTVLTFDDGFANFMQAAEVMCAHDYPATVLVATSHLGATRAWLSGVAQWQRMLTWGDVAELASLGIEVGAHAHTHVALDELDDLSIEREVRTSKHQLEDRLGREVRGFAYPFGYSDRRVRDKVRAAGYEYACAVKDSLSEPFDDPYAIARIFAPTTGNTDELERVLTCGNRRSRRHERVATKAWRTYRKARARRTRVRQSISATPR
jgi:peptidoglycan/xylan/chitin deacetylase (PgdA/CDA1 family)